MDESNFGPYEIVAEIGFGGMGTVYKAYDARLERQVAIKVLPPEYLNDLGLRLGFEREAQLVAKLEHEAIVPVYDYGEQDGQPYLVMKYMPNGSLADRLLQGPLPLEQVIHLLSRVAEALDYAHHEGIIHRDLKPSNILFDKNDQANLADFGIAAQSNSTWQRSSVIRGTPAYLSPEQALREDDIDHRSDIYSLGVIAFEMLSGVLPFDSETTVSIVLKHIHDQPPPLRAVNPELSPELDAALSRALAKDKSDRYSSTTEFINALQSVQQAGKDVQSLPEERLPSLDKTSVPDERPASSKPSLRHLPIDSPMTPNITLNTGRQVSRTAIPPRQKHYYQAISLTTWLGVFLAAVFVALTRVVNASGPANIRVIYDINSLAVVNISDVPLVLTGLTFQRISQNETTTATFEATQWSQLTDQTRDILPPGSCYLLLQPETNSFELRPARDLPKPDGCKNVQGWLVASRPDWLFWVTNKSNSSFRAKQASRVIQNCWIDDGLCEFYLPSR